MRIIEYIILFLVVVVGVLFAFLNSTTVSVDYAFGVRQMPLSLVVVTTLLCGGVLGLLSAGMMCLRLKFENKRLRKRITVAEKEIENLRTIPIRDKH